jgi:site-specific recombinase XerD
MNTSLDSAAARFDYAVCHARKRARPTDRPAPQLSAAWPPDNIALLAQYRDWLLSGGTGPEITDQIYVPTAGYVVGLNLVPHPQWELDTVFAEAHDYLNARRLSAISTHIRRNALEKFRRFLRDQRGQYAVTYPEFKHTRYSTGLPGWLVEPLERFQHLQQAHWRAARRKEQAARFWCTQARLWRWLLAHYPITSVTDLKRQYLLDYMDHLLAEGYAIKSVNHDLRSLHGFLLFLQDQDYRIPQALLRVPGLKEPESLPRFLTDEQVRRLRDDLEQRVVQASSSAPRRDALLDRAAFYLFWQGGLRLGEVEELRLADLNLAARSVMVRQGKGQKDRAVYLAATAVRAVQAYLAVRGQGPTDHVFFYRHKPVCKDLLRCRIRAAGARTGVKVTPHALRHTFATQLVNAACPITSIQKLLGHRDLSSTLIYGRVHDTTVAEDYFTAMTQIEKLVNVAGETDAEALQPLEPVARRQMLALVRQLAQPRLGFQARQALARQMRRVLNRKAKN